MLYYVYNLTTGLFTRGWPNKPPYDPATEAVQEYPEHLRPNQRTERHDATSPTKKRPATAQEIAAYDAERAAAVEEAQWAEQKLFQAFVMWVAQKQGISPAQARAEIMAIKRSL